MARWASERGANDTTANQMAKITRRRASRSEWNTVLAIPHQARCQRRSSLTGWLRGSRRSDAIRFRRWTWSFSSR